MSYQKSIDIPGYGAHSAYGVIDRLIRLRELLRASPLSSQEIFQQMPDDYCPDENGKRQLRRDIQNLEALGYAVQRRGRPVQYSLISGSYVLSDDDVQTLTYLRNLFAKTHPLTSRVQQLIDRLTQNLTNSQIQLWKRRTAFDMQLNPVLDYQKHEKLFLFLEHAILERRQIGFIYRSKIKPNQQRSTRWHPRLDPYEIEYSDRQFFLVAYSYEHRRILNYRIDRIIYDEKRESPKMLSNLQQPRREAKQFSFTYTLPIDFADGGVSQRFTIESTQPNETHVLIKARGDNEFQVLRTLLGYGEHALLIDGPPTLLEHMRNTVAAMHRQYFPEGYENPPESQVFPEAAMQS